MKKRLAQFALLLLLIVSIGAASAFDSCGAKPALAIALTAKAGRMQAGGSTTYFSTLTWTAPALPCLTAATPCQVSYWIFRGTAPGAESTTPINGNTVGGTTFTDAAVTLGVTYYYKIESVETQSGLSVDGTVLSNEAAVAFPSAPGPPTGVAGTAGSTSST